MAKWTAFPHAGDYRFDAASVKKHWARLHAGDAEPLPADPAVLDAWALFHSGEFERAHAAGLAAGGADDVRVERAGEAAIGGADDEQVNLIAAGAGEPRGARPVAARPGARVRGRCGAPCRLRRRSIARGPGTPTCRP